MSEFPLYVYLACVLYDSHQRVHDYLRISLTDACNFRCFYCMPNEEVDVTPQSNLMSKDEIFTLASLFVKLGVTKIRLTGGEPLVRKDVGEIMLLLATLPVKLTLTTNGLLLEQYLDTIQQAGIQSLNISLDTLHETKFELLTRRNQFQTVFRNIHTCLERNISVKVNVVVIDGINHKEINQFVALTKEHPIHIRFIEFMPFTSNHWSSKKVFTFQQMLDEISAVCDFIKLDDAYHDTAKKYQVVNHRGTFAVISTMTQPFCSTCNRLRLTADGKLKNCLFSKTETDLLQALRNGHDLLPLIIDNLNRKEAMLGGQLLPDYTQIEESTLENRSMIKIGG